mgnify:CR=1 FL=1
MYINAIKQRNQQITESKKNAQDMQEKYGFAQKKETKKKKGGGLSYAPWNQEVEWTPQAIEYANEGVSSWGWWYG